MASTAPSGDAASIQNAKEPAVFSAWCTDVERSHRAGSDRDLPYWLDEVHAPYTMQARRGMPRRESGPKTDPKAPLLRGIQADSERLSNRKQTSLESLNFAILQFHQSSRHLYAG